MLIFDKISLTRDYLDQQKKQGKTIGFVPTMGALHEGHLELMRRAQRENDLLVVSIFVNPIQFNNPEDLEKYPRTPEKDIALLEELGCDVLFIPEVNEMYPEGEEPRRYDFGPLEQVMEGAHRPGHFNGVAVVVKKLFEIAIPHRAYFGEKDFQQLAIIRKLVQIEKMDVDIVPCPTVREADGLAMSSRNSRLTPEERAAAPFIYETLKLARSKVPSMGVDEVRLLVANRFSDHPLLELEYFELAGEDDLQAVARWEDAPHVRGFVAAFLGKVRLIDNIRFT